MTPEPPFAADPLNPTGEELAAAIQRGLADGTLIDAADWMAREAEAHASGPEAAIAQASDDMIAMSVQRHAEAEAIREAQVVIDNAEWNALSLQEQEARMAAQDAAYEAEAAERAAEAEAEAELYAEDPEAEIG